MPRMSEAQRKRVANNVKTAISGEMTKQGMKRTDIERLLPFSRSTYSKRMREPGEITINELCLISNALNTTIDNLIHGVVSGTEG